MEDLDEVRSKKVKFQGTEYWLIDNFGGEGAIAPLEHCDSNGNVKLEFANEDSFAHLFGDGKIMRYGIVIGKKEDLEFVHEREI